MSELTDYDKYPSRWSGFGYEKDRTNPTDDPTRVDEVWHPEWGEREEETLQEHVNRVQEKLDRVLGIRREFVVDEEDQETPEEALEHARKVAGFFDRISVDESNVEFPEHKEYRRTNTLTGGQKGEKLEAYALIPVEPLAEVARVYGYGQRKYEARNWERGYEWSLSYSALMRHANAFWSGESIDPDSGRHHLASVVFHALAMMEWEETHPELDDRPKEEE